MGGKVPLDRFLGLIEGAVTRPAGELPVMKSRDLAVLPNLYEFSVRPSRAIMMSVLPESFEGGAFLQVAFFMLQACLVSYAVSQKSEGIADCLGEPVVEADGPGRLVG